MLSNFLSFALFAMDPMDQLDAHARSSFRLDATDTFIVLGAAVILVGLIFLWAVFLRRAPSEKYGASSLNSFSNRRSKSRRSSSGRSSSGSSSRRGSDSGSGEAAVRPRRPEPVGEGAGEVSASGRRMVRRRSSRRRSDDAEPADFQAADPKRIKVRKRRRRHHPDNYPRNPTLGETGGLPPLRPEDSEPAEGENNGKVTE